jgi:hypothetical protein
MKMAVFRDVAPCSLVEVYQCFRDPCCLHHQGDESDDGGSKDLWNVGKLLLDYTALQPRWQPSSYYLKCFLGSVSHISVPFFIYMFIRLFI